MASASSQNLSLQPHSSSTSTFTQTTTSSTIPSLRRIQQVSKQLMHRNSLATSKRDAPVDKQLDSLILLYRFAVEQGVDISPSVDYIIKYVLEPFIRQGDTTATTNSSSSSSSSSSSVVAPISIQTLGMALDVVFMGQSHAHWHALVRVMGSLLMDERQEVARMVLTRLPYLPTSAIQMLLMGREGSNNSESIEGSHTSNSRGYCGRIVALGSHPNSYMRRAAVRAASAIVIPDRAITAKPHSMDVMGMDALWNYEVLNPTRLQLPLSDPAAQPQAQEDWFSKNVPIELRDAVEKLVFLICESTLDDDDGVAVTALWSAVNFASRKRRQDPLLSTRNALASVMWDLLLANIPSISERMNQILDSSVSDRRWKREALASLSNLAATALSDTNIQLQGPASDEAEDRDQSQDLSADEPSSNAGTHALDDIETLRKWAVHWTEKKLLRMATPEGSMSPASMSPADVNTILLASYSLLRVAHTAKLDEYEKQVSKWTARALNTILVVLETFGSSSDRFITDKRSASASNEQTTESSSSTETKAMKHLSSSEVGVAVQIAVRALITCAQLEDVAFNTILASGCTLLNYAAALKTDSIRLCALRSICELFVAIELGVSYGSRAEHRGAVTGFLTSKHFSGIVLQSQHTEDTQVACELLTCLYQACLYSGAWGAAFPTAIGPNAGAGPSTQPSGPKAKSSSTALTVSPVIDSNTLKSKQREIAEAWASMAGKVLVKTARILQLPQSASLGFARECYLKLFSALGQFSAFLTANEKISWEEYENIQHLLINVALKQREPVIRGALIASSTRYWLESGLKAEATSGLMMKAMWRHLLLEFRDQKRAKESYEKGIYWVREMNVVETSTFRSEHAPAICTSAMHLVRRSPRMADQLISLLRKYLEVFRSSRCRDELVSEQIMSTLNSLAIYLDKYHPKPVQARLLMSFASKFGHSPLLWLGQIGEACVFATSRYEADQRHLLDTVLSEEAQHRAASSVRSLAGESLETYRASLLSSLMNRSTNNPLITKDVKLGNELLAAFQHEWDQIPLRESDWQILNASSDPIGITAKHVVLIQRGVIRLQIVLTNRTPKATPDLVIQYSCSGDLRPLEDVNLEVYIGSIPSRISKTVDISLKSSPTLDLDIVSIRDDESSIRIGAALVFMNIKLQGIDDSRLVEQPALPYYVPSSDVLLLRSPSRSSGLDAFRKRWDLLKSAAQFYVFLHDRQNLNIMVDVLERSSPLRQVGVLRQFSHFSALLADSGNSNYIAVGIYAAEAETMVGRGPCMAVVQVRSASPIFSESFALECREWLEQYGFRVVDLTNIKRSPQELKIYPRDQFYIKSGQEQNVHARWRAAQYARMSF